MGIRLWFFFIDLLLVLPFNWSYCCCCCWHFKSSTEATRVIQISLSVAAILNENGVSVSIQISSFDATRPSNNLHGGNVCNGNNLLNLDCCCCCSFDFCVELLDNSDWFNFVCGLLSLIWIFKVSLIKLSIVFKSFSKLVTIG